MLMEEDDLNSKSVDREVRVSQEGRVSREVEE